MFQLGYIYISLSKAFPGTAKNICSERAQNISTLKIRYLASKPKIKVFLVHDVSASWGQSENCKQGIRLRESVSALGIIIITIVYVCRAR